MFLHFLILKSGNDSRTRRCGTKSGVRTPSDGVPLTPRVENLK
jgi:hypothetical protein